MNQGDELGLDSLRKGDERILGPLSLSPPPSQEQSPVGLRPLPHAASQGMAAAQGMAG